MLTLWLYLLIIPFFIDTGSGDLYTSLKDSKIYPIFVFSLIIVPLLILLMTYFVKANYEGIAVDNFVNTNRKVLKIYGVGILLLIVLFGVFIVIVAIARGIIINSILCYQNFKKLTNN